MPWNIRISEVTDLQVQTLLQTIGGNSLAVREGAPYDPDTKPHIHIYIQSTERSESFIRKRIQQLDPQRKGNSLYSMSPAHENTPNYVLKKVYEETKGKYKETSEHPRIVFVTDNFLAINYGQWYNQYVAYVETVKQNVKQRRKVKRDSTLQMIIDIAEKHQDDLHLEPNDYIDEVVQWHTERDILLPSRSMMERYIITIQQRYKRQGSMRSYYAINFPNY